MMVADKSVAILVRKKGKSDRTRKNVISKITYVLIFRTNYLKQTSFVTVKSVILCRNLFNCRTLIKTSNIYTS